MIKFTIYCICSSCRKKITDLCIKKVKDFLNIVKPEVYFPAGGAYAIYGKFNHLNKYIAQASFPKVKSSLSKINTKVVNLLGGGSIKYDKKRFIINETSHYDVNKKFIDKISNHKYYYSENSQKIDIKKTNDFFTKATKNYFKILKKFKTKDNWQITFRTYKNLQLNKNCLIDQKKSKFVKSYILKKEDLKLKKKFKLECYMDFVLFNNLLKGKFPWNTSVSGSTIMFKRNPDIYNVDMDFSLNFLRV